jgi:DNA-binding PucR family transcriptional regulator
LAAAAWLEGTPGGVVVLDTVQCFLDNDLSTETTAHELGVHVNTIRQRLARFEEATGGSLRETEAIVEVWWALRRRRLR